MMTSAGSATTNYAFTGEWADGTGLVHLRARYLDPNSGRFMQTDLASGSATEPSTWNEYLYVMNDPTNRSDPSGMSPDFCFEPAQPVQADICRSRVHHQAENQSLGRQRLNSFSLVSSQQISNGGTCKTTHPNPRPIVINGNVTIVGLPQTNVPDSSRLEFDKDWVIDCVLSGISTVASGAAVATISQPEIAVIPIVVDIVVTGIGVLRTEAAFQEGNISQVRRLILNVTAIVGLAPISAGVASSLANAIVTCLRIPK